jgi:hypothetical protein
MHSRNASCASDKILFSKISELTEFVFPVNSSLREETNCKILLLPDLISAYSGRRYPL